MDTRNKKLIFLATLVAFVTIVLVLLNSYQFNSTEPPRIGVAKIQITTPNYIYRPPIKINNDFPKGKQVTVDVVIAFIAPKVNVVLDQLESWNENDTLPCDQYTVSHYYAGAQSNLVFYLNFGSEPQIEDVVNAKVESSIWRKCFNQIKFIYANNTVEEDVYPGGISVQFYKYYSIGPPSDYFFWMEADVKPLRKDWQIELFRLVIETNEVRGNKAFFVMGSNYIGGIESSVRQTLLFFPAHLNGNSLYWNNIQIYEQFLGRARWNEYRQNAFDADMAIQLHDPRTWDLVRNIRQEFITHDFIRNYNYYSYDKKEVLAEYPRTFFVHHSKNGKPGD